MSTRKNFSAIVSRRAHERAGAHLLGTDREPERFAKPLADDAFEVGMALSKLKDR